VTRTTLGFLFTVEWATYVGGALFMELIWRPLQRDVPPAQTGALCNAMGRRYRWVALGCLGLIAATAVGWSLAGSSTMGSGSAAAVGGPGSPGAIGGWRSVALLVVWLVLVTLVILMGMLVHPASHARVSPGQDSAELSRQRLRSIRLMDVLLRVELGVALVGALVAAWPHTSGPGPAM
jgi:uncharacterized membrane protein